MNAISPIKHWNGWATIRGILHFICMSPIYVIILCFMCTIIIDEYFVRERPLEDILVNILGKDAMP